MAGMQAAFIDHFEHGGLQHLLQALLQGGQGVFGIAEDTSDASIDCRQVGTVRITGELMGEPEQHRRPGQRRRVGRALRVAVGDDHDRAVAQAGAHPG